MENDNKTFKSNAKVTVDFVINVTNTVDGQVVTNNHMDGKFSMEINEVRETIRAAAASAFKGIADSLED